MVRRFFPFWRLGGRTDIGLLVNRKGRGIGVKSTEEGKLGDGEFDIGVWVWREDGVRLENHALRVLLLRCRRFESSDDCLYSLISTRTTSWDWYCKWQRITTSSKTSFSLYCVKALHSTYFTAPSSFAILSPSSFLTGLIFCLPNFSRTLGSSLKSV